jgi:DNA topoisomerase-1
MLEIYVGKYGLCVHEIAKTGKGRFVGIKDSKLEDVTLDKAIELFKYPYVLFNYQNKDVFLNKGQYGLYIKYDNKNYSIENLNEEEIDLDKIKNVIKNQKNYGMVKKITSKIELYNGLYGYYLKYNKKNYAVKKGKKTEEEFNRYIEDINEEECMKIIKKK